MKRQKRYSGFISTAKLEAAILCGTRCALCYCDIQDDTKKARVIGADGLERRVCGSCAATLREPQPDPEPVQEMRQLVMQLEVER